MKVADRIVGIKEILRAREERAYKQNELIQRYNHTLVSFTLNIPGGVKFNEEFKRVFDIGYQALIREMQKHHIMIIDNRKEYLFTGCEGYVVLGGASDLVKKITIDLEENHYLGRLFDMDVITNEMVLCSREEVGANARRCFLCKDEARVCGRSRKHSVEDLLEEIDKIMNQL